MCGSLSEVLRCVCCSLFWGVCWYLSEVFLSLKQFLLAGCRVRQQLVPALHQRSVTSLNGFGLHVFGCQELILQCSDVANALLLESLKSSIKGFLQ